MVKCLLPTLVSVPCCFCRQRTRHVNIGSTTTGKLLVLTAEHMGVADAGDCQGAAQTDVEDLTS